MAPAKDQSFSFIAYVYEHNSLYLRFDNDRSTHLACQTLCVPFSILIDTFSFMLVGMLLSRFCSAACRGQDTRCQWKFWRFLSHRVWYFRGRVTDFNQSEARKHYFLAPDWSKFETLPRKIPYSITISVSVTYCTVHSLYLKRKKSSTSISFSISNLQR